MGQFGGAIGATNPHTAGGDEKIRQTFCVRQAKIRRKGAGSRTSASCQLALLELESVICHTGTEALDNLLLQKQKQVESKEAWLTS